MKETNLSEILADKSFLREIKSRNFLMSTPCYELLLSLDKPKDAKLLREDAAYLKMLEEAGLVERKNNLLKRTPLGDAFALAEEIKLTASLAFGEEKKRKELAEQVLMLGRLYRIAMRKDKLQLISERLEGRVNILSKEINKLVRLIP